MNASQQTKPQQTQPISKPKERLEYVKPKLEHHPEYRVLIAGGGSI